jgi:hypothetical protein
MKQIAMKCTESDYKSIEDFVGDLFLSSDDDFIEYNYLCIFIDKRCVMSNLFFLSDSWEIQEVFDKEVFLKALKKQ